MKIQYVVYSRHADTGFEVKWIASFAFKSDAMDFIETHHGIFDDLFYVVIEGH